MLWLFSKLTIKVPKVRYWHCYRTFIIHFSVFILNFEQAFYIWFPMPDASGKHNKGKCNETHSGNNKTFLVYSRTIETPKKCYWFHYLVHYHFSLLFHFFFSLLKFFFQIWHLYFSVIIVDSIILSFDKEVSTAWKVYVFEVFLVFIFPHLNWIRTVWSISQYLVKMWENTDQKTLNTDTFYAV